MMRRLYKYTSSFYLWNILNEGRSLERQGNADPVMSVKHTSRSSILSSYTEYLRLKNAFRTKHVI